MSESMTLREFLTIPADYRTVTSSPRQCARLVLDSSGATVLEPVEIVGDFIAKLSRTVVDRSYGTPNGRVFIEAEARTRAQGMQAPHFSLTGTVWKSAGWARNGADHAYLSGGAMGETLARIWPRLALIEDLHLADAITGEPMHALENGWYFYSGKAHAHEAASPYHKETTDTPHERAARALRVDPADLPHDMDEDDFRAYVVEQAARWAREADAGRALILELAGGVPMMAPLPYAIEVVYVGSAGHLRRYKVVDVAGVYVPGGLFRTEQEAAAFIASLPYLDPSR